MFQVAYFKERKTQSSFLKKKLLLLFRAYIANPTFWNDIMDDIKPNTHQLNVQTHQYAASSAKQIRDRLSSSSNPGNVCHEICEADT